MEWEDDIRSPWSFSEEEPWSYSVDQDSTSHLELTVAVRGFDLQEAMTSDGASIILDDPHSMDESGPSIKCVVLGRLKDQGQASRHGRTHYVLLVTPAKSQDGGGSHVYIRVGVGYMPGDLIDYSEQRTLGKLR